jgi:hypothetical protein
MNSKDIIAANPQGKASLALLNDLQCFKSYKAKAKDVPEWLADYFTSLFVLSASFNFKPVVNKPYYLYLDNHQWKLSLIEPSAWSSHTHIYFAECYMHEDNSWSIRPDGNWQENIALTNKIDAIKKEFFDHLNNEIPILQSLPYFVEQLPYYRRLAAFGLAHSLKDSLQLKLGTLKTQNLSGKQLLEKCQHNNLLT